MSYTLWCHSNLPGRSSDAYSRWMTRRCPAVVAAAAEECGISGRISTAPPAGTRQLTASPAARDPPALTSAGESLPWACDPRNTRVGPFSQPPAARLITPARKFRMLLHTNPTRQRGKRTGSLARASGWYMTFFAAGVICRRTDDSRGEINPFLPTRRRPPVDQSLVASGFRRASRSALGRNACPVSPSFPEPDRALRALTVYWETTPRACTVPTG